MTLFTASQIREANLTEAKKMVKHNLANNDQWLIRGLLAIFARQTQDEKSSEATKHDNDIGFNGLDAGILTSFAKQVERWNATPVHARRFDSPLSPQKQMPLLRRKMAKYAGQLVRIAKATTPATV